MPKLNMETLLPFIEEAFNRGVDFQIPITGTSMNPLLYQNRDFVKIIKPSLPLKIGDIPLYRRADGAFVLHRVVDIKPNGEYVMCGDNQFILEYGITDSNIIGIAKTLVIDGKEIDVDTDAEYLMHKEKYLKNLKTRYPIRRLRFKLHKLKVASGKRKEESFGAQKCAENNSEYKVAEDTSKTQDIINVGSVLINAIKAQISGSEFQFPEDTDFEKLYRLSQNHRVASFVAPSVMKCSFADAKIKGAFSKELFKCAARYTAQSKEQEELSIELSKAQIKHCFLKGAKVSAFYEVPDARFMLDMDLYVEKDKFTEAEKILLNRGYECNSNGDDKDTGYIKKPFLIVELHQELKYDYDKGYDYYKGAFERMVSSDGFNMNMTNEDFYVYILSHTAHHFETAGTGIKTIIDHYYLKKKLKPLCNQQVLDKALSDIGLTQFNERIESLCNFWFEAGACSALTKQMSDFIILSGVFGNETNNYLSGVAQGRLEDDSNTYFLKRLFPPLKKMAYRYRVLKKLPILLPACWCVRIVSSVFDRKRISNERKMVSSVDASQKENQKNFLNDMGL